MEEEHWYDALRAAPVCTVSLPRRADRRREFVRSNHAGSGPIRAWEWHDGVDGLELDMSEVDLTLGLQVRLRKGLRNSHYEAATAGAVGCYLSKLTLLQRFLASGAEVAFLLEDDVQLDHGMWKVMQSLPAPPDDWQVLLVGSLEQDGVAVTTGMAARPSLSSAPAPASCVRSNRYVTSTANDGGWRMVRGLLGLQSFFITRRGAEVLLQHALPVDAQFDGYMSYLAQLRKLTVVRHPALKSSSSRSMTDIQLDDCRVCQIDDSLIFRVPIINAAVAFDRRGAALLAIVLLALVVGITYRRSPQVKK